MLHLPATFTPPYPLLLPINLFVTGKPVSSQNLIWHINEEANNAAIKSSINQHHKAMVTAHAKSRGETKDAKGKSKSKGKEKDKCHCGNCGKDGHTDNYYSEEGRGMAGKAPDWWVKNHKSKEKAPDWWVKNHKSKEKDKAKSTNTTKTEDKSEDNYAFLTFIPIDAPDYPANENVALTVTSGHCYEAHAASPSCSIIIDCGASSHFSPSHNKFLNYQEINPEPVHAADGCTFSTLSQGDLCISLPMKEEEKCSLLIKDGMCIICSPKPKHQVISHIPAICSLYCANSSITSSSPKHTVNVALKSITITGKLESKVVECKFIGIDEESKGYRVYWPNKHTVTVKRDIDFSKDVALNPDSIQIEEEWDLPANLDSPQASAPSDPPKTTSKPAPSTIPNDVKPKYTIDNPLPLEDVQKPDEINKKPAENL
ncbi:hypothetical protein C0995_012228 [Termitomyces sp. Mi166|nr:hypothetical protein C0995_012228 [Termitomyces sp. Mi166\